MNYHLNSNIEIHKFNSPSILVVHVIDLNSNIEIHKLNIQLGYN